MKPYVICAADDPQWADERRKRITASQANIFMGTAPDFYSETPESIIAQKLSGEDAPFDDAARRRMAHGREREANVLRMASLALGFPSTRYNYLIGNERWPYLAATLDGLMTPILGVEPDDSLTSQKGQLMEVRAQLQAYGKPVMAEVKVTDNGHRYADKKGKPTAGKKAWIDYCPTYHLEQLQTGLWIADLEVALLIGGLGAADLSVWLVARQDAWQGVMDELNSQAERELGALWK